MNLRNEESASRVQGELKAAREAMDAVYAEFVELTNALIVIGTAPELEPLAALLNADYKKIEEQMAQSRKLPTVLVKSEVVGNHRYSVPEYAKWADIVEANDKAFAIDRPHRLAGCEGEEGGRVVPGAERRGREAHGRGGREEGIRAGGDWRRFFGRYARHAGVRSNCSDDKKRHSHHGCAASFMF